ncbi:MULTISPECIES: hypothetical protein [unclassified Streptomyces]|uniref:hypothetical protein n=1 Tax=unclassified Streptomyces TaxID=2593676 RepID=UPI002E2E8074|nr:hypothetical protein [Streptomyces sp. NBC_00273]
MDPVLGWKVVERQQFLPALGDLRDGLVTNGFPSVAECTPWEELREAHLARLAAQRPAVA